MHIMGKSVREFDSNVNGRNSRKANRFSMGPLSSPDLCFQLPQKNMRNKNFGLMVCLLTPDSASHSGAKLRFLQLLLYT